MDKCRNCKYSKCERENGLYCDNEASEYYSDYVENDHVCLDYEDNRNDK